MAPSADSTTGSAEPPPNIQKKPNVVVNGNGHEKKGHTKVNVFHKLLHKRSFRDQDNSHNFNRSTRSDGATTGSLSTKSHSFDSDQEQAAPASDYKGNTQHVHDDSGIEPSTEQIIHDTNAHRDTISSKYASPQALLRHPENTRSNGDSQDTTSFRQTNTYSLPALQTKGPYEDFDRLESVAEDDPTSYDLVAPAADSDSSVYSLEDRAEHIFSKRHLQIIFNDPALFLRFTSFLGTHRKQSLPVLVYYLDALKAIRAINYSNAILEALTPLPGLDFSKHAAPRLVNKTLEERLHLAFAQLVQEDLPAFVTHTWIDVVSESIQRRITGTLPPHLREASEGLAEVFCLSDPSRPDNPIVFASEEFHRTTQYGMAYAIGRNCRFLQGPRTNVSSVKRLREAVKAGRDHCETFLNYRRDGSPFLNLLMMAPLRDSRGVIRYYIGAQVDISGLAKECTNLEGLRRMLEDGNESDQEFTNEKKDEFQELTEMFNRAEVETARKHGGRMHQTSVEDDADNNSITSWQRPRLLLNDPENTVPMQTNTSPVHGKLSGIYSHYLLVRPHPSLRIIFTSPSLRVPGILQSPLMNRIGSSDRVRNELVAAFAEGRGVTAKVRWVSRNDDEGRNRWLHCTPLLGHDTKVGVWMIVLVDDESSRLNRKFRPAPPVTSQINGQDPDMRRLHTNIDTNGNSRPRTAQSSYSDTKQSSVGLSGPDEFSFNVR